MERRTTQKVSSTEFYNEYYGHRVTDLEKLLQCLREKEGENGFIIFTAGDSSLDNKYWFHDRAPSPGPYQDVLDPPVSVCDVTYWLQTLADQRGGGVGAINTAVEATTLNGRTFALRPQDSFIRDNIQENDVLIVSVGGNDIALMPAPCTIFSILGLLYCCPSKIIENTHTCGVMPCDDYCCGCSTSLLSCLCTFPPCGGYFRHLFGTRVETYIRKLTSKTRPRKVLVCMIYYPDENQSPSWAGGALAALGYNTNPEKLQLLIRTIFEKGTSEIKIAGTKVIPVPLFVPLDGSSSSDYVARVEPSARGGKKMAEYLLRLALSDDDNEVAASAPATAPSSTLINRH